MNDLKEIEQISIYLIEEAERVNEVALFQPLMRKSQFNEESKPIAARKWRYTANLPFYRRILLKLQSLAFKHFPPLIPSDRLTPEAKFKTVLAILLAQESVRDYFLTNANRRKNFLNALDAAATSCNYPGFSHSLLVNEKNPLDISRQLTQIKGKETSLIDDLKELNLQMAALKHQERSEILYRILNHVERPPITSVIEITSQDATQSVPLTTKYAKYKIHSFDKGSGKIQYAYEENRATSSIRTMGNSLPDAKGTMNQRIVFEATAGDWIGSYCGELSTPFHVLEQILFILEQTGKEATLLAAAPAGMPVKRQKILFTSLYSWDEIGLITDQRAAIAKWDQKVLKCGADYYFLDLLYFNIPFNALNKYPTPGEIKAAIQDINDEALIILIAEAWEKMGEKSKALKGIASKIQTLRGMDEKFFIEKKKASLKEIDAFRELKNTLISHIDSSTMFNRAVKTFLLGKKPSGKVLKGIDKLIYLDYIVSHLGYFHNKNCQNATDRSAGADAADKAQHTFYKLFNAPFLPGNAQEAEKSLFKVLYSMYLVWEEPEINTALSTGFTGEKFYNNFFQKNPETTRYLIRWLKKHPELYLGLSDYRT